MSATQMSTMDRIRARNAAAVEAAIANGTDKPTDATVSQGLDLVHRIKVMRTERLERAGLTFVPSRDIVPAGASQNETEDYDPFEVELENYFDGMDGEAQPHELTESELIEHFFGGEQQEIQGADEVEEADTSPETAGSLRSRINSLLH